MALDPLKFAVQITDNATQELNRIKTLIEQLPDKSINVNVSGNLGEVLNLLNGGINSSSFDGIKSAIGEALSSLNGINNAAKEGNFSAYAEQVNAAKDAVAGLANALSGLNAVAGNNEGWQKFMAGIGEVVTRVDAAVKKLGEAAGNESSGNSAFGSTYKNIEKAKNELRKFDDIIKQAETSSRLGKQFGDIDTSKLDAAIERLKAYRAELEQIKDTGKSDKGRKFDAFALDAGYKEAVADVKRLATEQHTTEINLGRYNQMLTETNALWDRIIAAWVKGSSLHGCAATNPTMQPAEQQAREFMARLQSLSSSDLNNTKIIQQLAAEYQRLKGSLTATASAQEKLNAATEKQRAKDAADAAKKAQKEDEAWAKSMREASKEANKLGIELNKLRKTEAAGSSVGVNTSQLRQYIGELETYKRILDQIAQGNRGLGHTSEWMDGNRTIGRDSFGNTSRSAKEAAGSVRELTTEKQRAANATQQLTADQQRLAQALNHTAESARGQSQILSDLKSMAMQYLGVWGGQQFLNNIIQIGGQLEMQRLSIGAILQNQSQANDLFEKIKGLAVQSPFGVVELDQMTKQLTAYGFKYNELFDMTKRLADISAATGTGVDRLALALGHVRSEAALSGYTLRQFSMGNVPLLQKLSEKLGKTTQEIRKMVRAKEISYEDVVGVLKDLTDEGGMFYNMQEVISESVKAKFKNVKDAMDIMYGEMAEGSIGGVLKNIATGLMEVTKNWKDVVTILGTGAAAWATMRVATLAYTTAIGNNNAAVLSSIAAHRQREASVLRDAATYRALTLAEMQNLAASKNLTLWERTRLALGGRLSAARKQSLVLARRQQVEDTILALREKKLTSEMVLQQVAYGKLTKMQAISILQKGRLSQADLAAAMAALKHTERLRGMSLALDVVGNSIRKVALAMKALAPQALFMGAITALMELWQRHNQEMERAEELGQNIYQQSQDAIKNTQTMLKEYDASLLLTNGKGQQIENAQFSDLGIKNIKNAKIQLPEFDTEIAEQAIEQWSQYIREYAANPSQILNNALFDTNDNVRELKDQFDKLREAVSNVALAQYGLQDMGNITENAVKATNSDWVIDDDVVTNIKDYMNAVKKANAEIGKLYSSKWRAGFDKGIAFAKEHSKAFAEATKDADTYAEAFGILIKRANEFPDVVKTLEDFSGANISSFNVMDKVEDMNKAREKMDNDMQTYYIQLKAQLETEGVDLQHMSENQQQALLLAHKNVLEQAGNASEAFMKEQMIAFAQEFHIPIDLDDEKFLPKISEAKRLLGELINEDWKVDLKFATNITDVLTEARKQYKAAKDFYANAEPVLLKFGVKMKIGDTLTPEQIAALVEKAPKEAKEFLEQLLKGANEASKLFNQATEASRVGGFSLEDPTKKKEKTKKKTGSKKAYKDTIAEEWKERIRLLKDANSLYKDWIKRHVGEEEALKHVKDQYADIFEKWKTDKNLPWKDFSAKDIIEYRNYIQKIVDEATSRYNAQRNDKAKNYGKEAEAVMREGKKLLDDIKKFDFDETAKNFTSTATKSIEQLNKRWEIFKATVDATGDAMLASQLAGFGDVEEGARTAADAMRNELIKQLQEKGGAGVVAKVPLDVDLDEERIEDALTKAIPDADNVDDYKEAISGLIAMYKEWQKLQQKANQEDINMYVKIIGLANSYEAQLRKINRELKEQMDAISANPSLSISQKTAGSFAAKANADWKKMKMSADYVNLHNKAISMSADEYKRAKEAIEGLIEKLRLLGMISPEEAVSETNAINKSARERNHAPSSAFAAFITGGSQGLRDFYQGRADVALEKRERLNPVSAEWKKADAEYKKNQEKADQIDKEIAEIEQLQSALGNLRNAANLLSNLFSSLGGEAEGTGNVLGGALNGASSLSGFGPWGMAAGALLGFATSAIQEGDKALERNITDLRGDVQSIESITDAILKNRERSLGYDNNGDFYKQMFYQYGRLVNEYADLASAAEFDSDEMNKYHHMNWGASMMQGYYQMLYNQKGNGYQEEYNNLLKERDAYLEILDQQRAKKNWSQADIAETTNKITELDDKIYNFTQDLAKELWGIDVKGWADQLSDALASAFENGTNMAKAYREAVTNIIQQMMQKMMQLAILQPMFEKLQGMLFGDGKNKGAFDINDPQGSMSKVTEIIGKFFGKGGDGEKAITASMEFMTAFQKGMQNAGLTVLNEATNTLSSGIQGTSEETSDLLAGYVNALRQDVSVNRILLTQFVSQLWPDYIDTFSRQVTAVENIDVNVQTIMAMMQMGSGAMYEQIAAMRTRIDNVAMGIEQFSVR